jgi:hypothetical protein
MPRNPSGELKRYNGCIGRKKRRKAGTQRKRYSAGLKAEVSLKAVKKQKAVGKITGLYRVRLNNKGSISAASSHGSGPAGCACKLSRLMVIFHDVLN